MVFHPRERPRQWDAGRQRATGLPRREFIRLSMLGAATAGLGPGLLTACGGDSDDETAGAVELSRPDRPVTLPRFDDVEPIDDDLPIESGTLKVFNYQEYISPDVLAAFEDEFGVTVEVTTFISMDEAIAKLSSGDARFDVFFPTADVIGKVAAGKLLQPLNKSYIPNLSNAWESLQDPFYDAGSVYSVPYTLFSTGIGYRVDAVAKTPDMYDNPYDIFWDTANGGQVYLLEDDREVFGMALLRRGHPDVTTVDVNTEDAASIDAALGDVTQLNDLVSVKLGAEAYTVLPEKRTWVHQAWSGDVVNAQYYLPEGETIENIGYWYPADGGGMIGSDTIAVMRGAERPVLAHTFINYLLDATHSIENYSWLGYQPPQRAFDPDLAVADGYVPEHLASAIIRPQDFERGHQLLQLSLAGEKTWDDAWSKFIAGA
jgi:spermidine/putrescine transport system substrate-binding protein